MVFGADWKLDPLMLEEMEGREYSAEELRTTSDPVYEVPCEQSFEATISDVMIDKEAIREVAPVDGRIAHGGRPFDPRMVDASALPPCPRPHCGAATGEHCRTWKGALCWPHKPRLRAAGKIRPKRRRRKPKPVAQ